MVGVVQLVERQFVALVVAGSSPVAYPILEHLKMRQWLNWIEHQTSDLRVRGSSPLWRTNYFGRLKSDFLFYIIKNALVAQLDRAPAF